MDQVPAPDASAVATSTDVATSPAPPAADVDRPESLAEALGQDGPGIAAEIESELAGGMADPEPQPTEAIDATAPPEGSGDAGQIEAPIDMPDLDRLGILADLNVTLSARLCATSQPLGTVLSLKPGSIVDLGRAADAPIELVANGVVVAYGEVVAVGSSLGVRVTGLASST